MVICKLISLRSILALSCMVLFSHGAFANCCNIITTQSCANCNIFMCHCENSCDCQNSCGTTCDLEFDACLADCTQRNCNYCTSYFHSCTGRCGKTGTDAVRATPAALPADAAAPKVHCEQIFAAFDANSDRLISNSEFLAFLLSQPRPQQRNPAYKASVIGIAVASVDGKELGQVFTRIDVDRSGSIDRTEAGLDTR